MGEPMNLDSIDPELLVQGAQEGSKHLTCAPSVSSSTSPTADDRPAVFGPAQTTKRRSCRFSEAAKRRLNLNSLTKEHKEKNLRQAAGLNNVERVTGLLQDSSVDPNAPDEHGRRALHIAASRGYAQVVEALIRAGANPDLEDLLGNTPLHLAVYTGCLDTVLALLSGGCRVRRTAQMPYTPLELARSKYNLLKSQNNCQTSQLQVFRVILLLRHAVLVDVTRATQEEDIDGVMANLAAMELQEREQEDKK